MAAMGIFEEDVWALLQQCGGSRRRLRSSLVVLDETHVHSHASQHRTHGRSQRGRPCVRREFLVRGKRLNVFAVFTERGFLSWRIMERNGTAEEYRTFVWDCVVPHMNAFPNAQSLLLMDNARIHLGDTVEEWMDEIGARVSDKKGAAHHAAVEPAPD